MVQILVQLGERLGREQASKVLISTLQCFFACFSGANTRVESETPQRRNSKVNGVGAQGSKHELSLSGSQNLENFDLCETPTNTSLRSDSDVHASHSTTSITVTSPATEVHTHPLTVETNETVQQHTPSTSDTTPKGSVDTTTGVPDNEAYRQVCLTFSPAMAHASYVPFCRLLGQYYLNDQLYNTDLIEQIVYKQDDSVRSKSPLPTVLCETSDSESDLSSEAEDEDENSDSEAGFERDAALKVGPIAAITGLGQDSTDFGRSSWFVNLEGEETGTKVEEEVRKST